MLGKLLRYEFKALLRIMPALYLAILALAVVTGINNYIAGDGVAWDMAGKLEIALGLMFVALFVVNLIIVILRFRDNLLKDEGYLMFTLPVTGWELAASKAITSLCFFLLTAVVGILALLIDGFIADFYHMLEQLSRSIRNWNELVDIVGPVSLAIQAAIVLIFFFQQICLVYASMTVSQMAPRFRGLAGFGVYLALMTAVTTLVGNPLSRDFFIQNDIPYHTAGLLLQTAFAALFFWCTGWLLKHTLNLE
jgi:uncharacterized membrane protein YhaH (DUF805 family)